MILSLTYDPSGFTAQSGEIVASTDNVVYPSLGVDANMVFQGSVYPDSMEGKHIYIVPKLFGDGTPYIDNGIPSKAWRIIVPDDLSSPVSVNANLIGFPIPNTNKKNLSVTAEFTGAYDNFTIIHSFFMLADTDQYLDEVVSVNNTKTLTYNHQLATTQFDNSFPSVYNESKFYQCVVYVVDPDTNEYDIQELTIDVNAAFLNVKEENGTSRLSNKEIELSRDSNIVTELSSFDDTLVTIKVQDPAVSIGAGWSIICIGAWLIEKQITLSSVGWKQAWDGSFVSIISTDAGTSTVDNIIKNPSVESTLASGEYTASFTVDSSLIEPSKQYRIYAIYALTDGSNYYNETFTSDWLNANASPEPFDLDFYTKWNTLGQSLETNLQPSFTIGERTRLDVVIDKDSYDDNAYLNGIPFVDFETDFNKIVISIYDNAAPSAILKTINIYYAGSVLVTDNPSLVDYTELISGGQYSINLRMLYYTLSSTNLNFVGKDIRIKHEIYFQYDLGFDTWITKHEFEDAFTVGTYNAAGKRNIWDWIKAYELCTGKPLKNFCAECDVLIKAKLKNTVDPTLYKFVAIVDKSPYSGTIGNDQNILEHEVWNEFLDAETDSPIYDVAEDFDPTTRIATYKIPYSYFEDLQNYAFAGIAIKITEGRITDDEIIRITDSGETRITD